MSDKHLSSSGWKTFAKSGDYKDAAWLKALVELEKAAKADAAERLPLIDEAAKQAELLLKSAKGDKSAAAYLDEAQDTLKQQRKAAAAQAEKDAQASDDEDQAPDLLTTGMVPLLRAIKKGDSPPLPALIAVAGKGCAVLIARKPIAPPRRKLLADYLDNASGIKYLAGQCLWEAEAYTFVLPGGAAGMAKKLQAALLEQTAQRCKVRARGEDPDDVDSADEDEGSEVEAEAEAAAPAAEPTDAAESAQVQAALTKLLPALQAAMASHPERKEAIAKALSMFPVLFKAGKVADAKKLVLQLASLLKTLQAPAQATGTEVAPPPPPPPRDEGRLVAYRKLLLEWDQAKKQARAQIAGFRDTVSAQFPSLRESAATLDQVMERFNDGLADALDDILNAANEGLRQRHRDRAVAIAQRYFLMIRTDPLFSHVDQNPVGALTVRDTLGAPLKKLIAALA